VRHFPGAGDSRECDAGNLAEPAPTLLSCCAGTLGIESSGMPPLASVANLTTGYGGLSGLIGLGWDQSSRGLGLIISGAAMRRSSCSPECIPSSPKNRSGIRP
jgi:hypothetical protein